MRRSGRGPAKRVATTEARASASQRQTCGQARRSDRGFAKRADAQYESSGDVDKLEMYSLAFKIDEEPVETDREKS